ncbi:membrane-spanning 4-domains subfamily A member 12-like [Myotis daubentonii]|uniref:membrane-spanning 4-domains subfamily A member 12-like n=1 Tax=Myotis daubentonii TaxID=98922 RepID=UPI002872C164|nr:membrane-spanning 4-domains subfamily A member 12-like [Myotis daubentonii]
MVGKERGQQELESIASTPIHGRAGYRRLGLLDLSFSPHLFPLSFPSCLSLVQVSSSLRTNILRAMAAFAGSAILLMDFGVTHWDVGRGYLAVLTIFTILEFFIAVIATHFGRQATLAQANVVSASAPTWAAEEGVPWEGSLLPDPPCFPLRSNPAALGFDEFHSYKWRGPKEVFAGRWDYFPRGHRGHQYQ